MLWVGRFYLWHTSFCRREVRTEEHEEPFILDRRSDGEVQLRLTPRFFPQRASACKVFTFVGFSKNQMTDFNSSPRLNENHLCSPARIHLISSEESRRFSEFQLVECRVTMSCESERLSWKTQWIQHGDFLTFVNCFIFKTCVTRNYASLQPAFLTVVQSAAPKSLKKVEET